MTALTLKFPSNFRSSLQIFIFRIEKFRNMMYYIGDDNIKERCSVMLKDNKVVKVLCLVFLVSGFIYGLVLPFCWGNNPFDPLGTLSLLCEHRKIYFWLWIILGGGGLFLNINYMYDKFGKAGKFIKALPVIAVIFAVTIALTLDHSIANWNPKRIVHWVSTGGYVAFLFMSLAFYAIKNLKTAKIFRVILAAVFVIFLTFLVWFLAFGKSGMLEIVPYALLQIFLLVINFFVKSDEKAEAISN